MSIIGTRTARDIVAVCRDLGIELPDGEYRVRRTRAGRHQVAGGAWSWALDGPEGAHPIVSQWAAGDVIRAHRIGLVVLYCDTGSCPELLVEPYRTMHP